MKLKSLFGTRKRTLAIGTLLAGGLVVAGAWTPTFAPRRGQEQPTRRSTDPPMGSTGKLCQDLFMAIDHRNTAEIQALLKNGADPNSRNGLQFSPLYIAGASHQTDVMQILLQAGAELDAESPYGTPLTFTAMGGNAQGVKLLLDKGAKPNAPRNDGKTPLMMAANSGSPETVSALLAAKADVQATDINGATALQMAARGGYVAVGKQLLDAGAKANDTDLDHQTVLMTAAMNGKADFVKLLLQRKADPNARDDKGRTAVILAAAYGDYPEVISALKAAGADANAKDTKGCTAAAFAASRGYKKSLALLGKPTPEALAAAGSMPTARQAVTGSLKIIQSSMKEFSRNTRCISCHQEGLGRITTGEARARGLSLDAEVEKTLSMRVNGTVDFLRSMNEGALKSSEAMKQLPLIEINEVTPIDAWLLAGMAAQKEPVSESKSAMAMVLGRQQNADGFWSFSLPRVPMQSSPFTFTAYAIQGLQTYGPKTDAAEIKDRIARAKAWLLRTPAKTSEDRAMRLLGLKWSGCDAKEIQKARAEVLADQHADGGWSQLPSLQSDAYATGQALYALRQAAGMAPTDPVYKRGAQYLLRTQDPDGSWFVNKRAIPANNYFDGGFPHGESQYASFNGTCWATLALMETLGAK